MLWRSLIRPLFFCIPAERAHYVAMSCFELGHALIGSRYQINDARLSTHLFDIHFPNPVGLAAGFDKNGLWFNQLSKLGFGHVEIGTLTAHAQPGNPKPRLFRLPQDKALINRMGFNNQGSELAAATLANTKINPIVGINIGKSKITELENASEDYRLSFERLFEFAQYFTINVSSPNTPGLRKLQNRSSLEKIITTLQASNRITSQELASKPKPILLKIAPDLTDEQIDEIGNIAIESSLDGVIATNTTISREHLKTSSAAVQKIGDGGLSGSPLTVRSRQVVARLYQQIGHQIPVIGCGGIMNGEDAWRMICAGASMIQVYTGFIYGGPGFVRDINKFLLDQLSTHQFSTIREAVGLDYKS